MTVELLEDKIDAYLLPLAPTEGFSLLEPQYLFCLKFIIIFPYTIFGGDRGKCWQLLVHLITFATMAIPLVGEPVSKTLLVEREELYEDQFLMIVIRKLQKSIKFYCCSIFFYFSALLIR